MAGTDTAIEYVVYDASTYDLLKRRIYEKYGTTWAESCLRMTNLGYDYTNIAQLAEYADVKPIKNAAGEIVSFEIPDLVQNTRTSPVNSNSTAIVRGRVNGAVSTGVSQTGKVTASRLAGVGTKTLTAIGKAAVPLTLASIGITLGKTIDETLYNANPDYWNSIGLSTLNPDTWAHSIIHDDGLGEDVFNLIFGIDPQTGDAQAYMDANAFAYGAYCMNEAGVFGAVTETGRGISEEETETLGLPYPFQTAGITYMNEPVGYTYYTYPVIIGYKNNRPISVRFETRGNDLNGHLLFFIMHYPESTRDKWYLYAAQYKQDGSNFPYNNYGLPPIYYYADTNTRIGSSGGSVSGRYSANSSQYISYFSGASLDNWVDVVTVPYMESNGLDITNNAYRDALWQMVYGDYSPIVTPSVPGINNQSGATIPNFEGLDEDDYLNYLQTTYPDLFSDAINYPVAQEDGSVINHTYVPITLPNGQGWSDTQPVSNGQTQANPDVNPETSPVPMIELLTRLLQQPEPQTATDPYGNPTPPNNPTDTGDGSSPTPVPATGSASSLWKIYHPTKAQIDSFGGWLWSSNFLDQILKIFNDPMQAIIGLHQVYVTPTDAGTSTIHVGYLDSGVPSAYIENQYEYISCGSIDLYEEFGNVFDYSPYTDVQLYLPFIGIVPLNVSDVMRSTITVEYGVDVLTGACLAMVSVERDMCESVLYQYSGNCAVQYPISSGSYMGIVSSIISVAGGVAATVASGGAAAPLALGAAGGLLNAHTSVQHSGGFSGNAGAMGGKMPYLIITRPQTNVADNAETMIGFPANTYTTINECSGFVKAESVHVVNVNATDEEIDEINNLFMSGIII